MRAGGGPSKGGKRCNASSADDHSSNAWHLGRGREKIERKGAESTHSYAGVGTFKSAAQATDACLKGREIATIHAHRDFVVPEAEEVAGGGIGRIEFDSFLKMMLDDETLLYLSLRSMAMGWLGGAAHQPVECAGASPRLSARHGRGQSGRATAEARMKWRHSGVMLSGSPQARWKWNFDLAGSSSTQLEHVAHVLEDDVRQRATDARHLRSLKATGERGQDGKPITKKKMALRGDLEANAAV